MTNIDDLNNPSLSEMSEEQLLELLGRIRSNRRKQPKKQTKSTSGRKEKKQNTATKMLKNMTNEEREKLLIELGGNDENKSS